MKVNSCISVNVMTKFLTVKTYDFHNGLQLFENIEIIRINSKDYTLLIMPDYMPTMGELEGNLDIVGKNVQKNWKGIKGYYVIRHNIFEVILKDEYQH